MRNKIVAIGSVVALSLASIQVASAGDPPPPPSQPASDAKPNCDVDGKHIVVKDKAECDAKHGTWAPAPSDKPKPH